MRPEQTERLFIENMFNRSLKEEKVPLCKLKEVEKLTGDASTRRYFRIITDKVNYVACLTDPTNEQSSDSDFLIIQRILDENKIRVPYVFDHDLEKGYILEEDLGNTTLLVSLAEISQNSDELDIYRLAIDEQIKMNSLDLVKYSEEIFNKRSFDVDKLMSEIDFSIRNFISNYLNSESLKNEINIIREEFLYICTEIVKQEYFFTHRDFHSRNIMVSAGEQIIIDFQDARLGPCQYDLVSLLDDCYYSITEENIEVLKKYYYEQFAKLHYKSYDDFIYVYDLVAVQRLFKAIGSFSYIYYLRNDLRYLKYIGHGFEKLRQILGRYQKFKKLKMTLGRIYYDN
jgi:aminoglycoside/choline kinase family phosphotransferase